MNYPDCPESSSECRFSKEMAIVIYSPFVYDRNGERVGGGEPIPSKTIECMTCNRRWNSEKVTGQRDWKPR